MAGVRAGPPVSTPPRYSPGADLSVTYAYLAPSLVALGGKMRLYISAREMVIAASRDERGHVGVLRAFLTALLAALGGGGYLLATRH
jgi:hypothetical protein